jgi:N-acetylmuramoyl-L-alanine amidase
MKMKFLSLITFAFLTAGFSGHAAAEEVTVKKGDTLWDIAERNEVEVEQIIDLNNLQSDLIHPEDELELHLSHEIITGDTLWDIAKEYQVEVEDLEDWNQLDSDIIQPGDELTIKETENDNKNTSITNKNSSDEKASKSTKDSSNKKVSKSTKDSSNKKASTSTKDSNDKKASTSTKDSNDKEENSKELTVTATAYTANCEGCSGTTKTGVNLKENPDKKVIAVDPKVIPLGSTVEVEGYGTAIAADIGGAIKGNKIDVFIPSKSEAIEWGRKKVKVKIID